MLAAMSPTPPAAPPAPAPLVAPGVPSQPPTSPSPVEEASRPARWADRITALFLLAAATLLLGALTPPVLRVLGVGAPSSPVMRAERLPLPERETEPRPRRTFFEGGDEGDDEDDFPGVVPPHALPHRGGQVPSTGGPMLMALARHDLLLHADPDPGSATLGQVESGDTLMVMKESGDWALVIRTGAEGVLMGWARRSEIAVR